MSDNGSALDPAGPAFIDTNMIARYFLQDVPTQNEQVRRVINDSDALFVTEGTINEVGYVLTKIYRLPRETVVDALIALLRRDNVHVYGVDNQLAIEALRLCRPSGRVSFADAMLWAIARAAGSRSRIYTLDNRFPSLGIEIRRDL